MNVEDAKRKKIENPYKIKANQKLSIKDVSEKNGKGIVTGFATTYNYFDHDGDVGVLGHLDKSMNERGVGSSGKAKIKHLLHHDWTKVITIPTILENRTEVIKGVSVTGQYFESELDFRQDGHLDTYLKYESGIYDNHSYGFNYIQLEYVEDGSQEWEKYLDMLINPEDAKSVGCMWIQKESMQYEFSTVAIGANELTPNLGVKSNNKIETIDNLFKKYDSLTKALRLGRFTDETMHEFEYQSKQIKQMIIEITKQEPFNKDTLKQEPSTNDTQFNLMNAIKNL